MKTLVKIIIGVVIAGVILIGGGLALTLFTANEVVKEVDNTITEMEKETKDKDALLKEMLEKAPEPVEVKNEIEHYVEYTLTNDTDQDFDYIELRADTFDKDGTKLDTAITNITDVKAGQTFKLKLYFLQEGVASYEVTKITSSALE